MPRRIFDFLSSLKLTVTCLSLAIILVFVGTLAQVDSGIYEVQRRYFQSLVVWWPATPGAFSLPVFPGGHLLGAVLLLNLVAAHARRFRWTWKKFGIHLTHAGLIILLVGGLFTDLFSVESFLRLAPGETKNYSEDPRAVELAVIDGSDSGFDQVAAIPESRLRRGGTIGHGSLPFRIIVRRFYQNSRFQPIGEAARDAAPAATRGPGSQIAVFEVPRATAMNERDLQSAVIEIVPASDPRQSLGTWLVSGQLGAPQTVSCEGKTWRLAMRPARYYKPYSLTLRKFSHERYPGTEIPKNFASHAVLTDPEHQENRDVLISMNHPLRYRGDTYFQSGFEKGDTATILQVVYNPGFIAPYVACAVVGTGLLYQFALHFAGFLNRRKTTP
ncbi:MAG: cytochrome c biogenesis protein ResB [Terrimicrobiaceae bacterium]